MCGIAGIYRFDGSPADPGLVQGMTRILEHRGPDDEGLYLDGALGLGHRRLSIMDPTPAGRQPMSNEDGSVWLTFNGEIYNFRELRRELEAKGHRFRSGMDGEVILHLYEEAGERCVERLEGMFAFAVWDRRRRRLLLARDRMGIKPLFFSRSRRRLLFGSEIKALLCDPTLERRIDLEALQGYLAFNYTLAPRTLFQDVEQLLPGHRLVADADGRVEVAQYWDLAFSAQGDGSSERRYADRLEAELAEAVKRQLVCDVPFGLFLSGGFDSSMLLYFMARQHPQPIKAFSIDFDEPSYSELPFAREAAGRFGAESFTEMVRPDLTTQLPRIVWHAEEPTADASMVPLWYLAKLARRHVKMALSGDGGDELFAGYDTYPAWYGAHVYRAMPSPVRRMVRGVVSRWPVSERKMAWGMKLNRFVRGAEEPAQRSHAYWRIIHDPASQQALFADRFGGALDGEAGLRVYDEYVARAGAVDSLHRLLYVDTRCYLPNDMLVKVDRMSMAHGLEVRVPLLDDRLVAFAASVPSGLKLKAGLIKKHLPRRVMRGKLPRRIFARPKAGFVVPVSAWLRGPLREFAGDRLSPERIARQGLFKPAVVSRLLHEHGRRTHDHGYRLWSLLILDLWHEQFMETSGVVDAMAGDEARAR